MNFDEVLVAALIPLPVLDAVATIFFFRLYLRSGYEAVPGSDAPHWRSRFLQGRSWLLGLLTASFAIITTAFVIVGLLSAGRIFAFRVEGGVVLLAIALIALGAIPPAFMWAFWLTRERPVRLGRAETAIEAQDRKVGDARRELQAEEADEEDQS